MSTETSTASKGMDRTEFVGLIEKLGALVATAEAIAQRNVGKVRTLAVLDLLAGIWLGYAFYDSVDWGWVSALIVLALVVSPAVVLWKIHGALQPMIGLPQRLTDAVARMHGKAMACKERFDQTTPTNATGSTAKGKPKFRELWESARLIADVRSLSGEAREIAAEAGGALVLANPVFPIVLGVASALAAIVVALGIVVGCAYVF